MIDGVIITPLKRIPDERGTIMHFMRNDDPNFTEFGEVYFSYAYSGVIKAWHRHTKMTLNYVVPIGMVKLVLYDNRENSTTKGELMELFMGDDNYIRVTIPKGVWNGHKVIGTTPALLANCATHPYESGEMERMDPFDNKVIDYDWEIKMS